MANNFLFCELQKPRATGPEPPRRELSKTGLKVRRGLVLMTWQPTADRDIISLEHCSYALQKAYTTVRGLARMLEMQDTY